MLRSTAPRLAAVLALLSVSTATTPAYADTEGGTGRISRLRINAQGSENQSLFQGSLVIRSVGSGELTEYRWGGSSCPGQKLNEHQQDILVTAMVERSRTKIKPSYTMGEGGTRCLVGFELIAG